MEVDREGVRKDEEELDAAEFTDVSLLCSASCPSY